MWCRMASGLVLIVEDESLILLDVEQSLLEAGFGHPDPNLAISRNVGCEIRL